MNKANIFLCLSLFLSSNFQLKADNDAGVIAASAAAGAVAGFGIYQLFSAIANTSDKLVDDACKELMICKAFSKQLQILEDEFAGLSNIDKKQEIMAIDEDLLEDIANAANGSLMDDVYFSQLKTCLKNIKYYQTKLPKRIRKLQRERNIGKFQPIIDDMQELVKRINLLVPKMELLQQYANTHKRYFGIDADVKSVANSYKAELKQLESKKIYVGQIKNIIDSKFAHSSYPMLDYVTRLESDIAVINSQLSYANRYEDLLVCIKKLKHGLNKIKEIVVSDREYHSEQRALERERSQNAFNAGMFFLGATAGAAVAATTTPVVEEVVIVEEPVCEPVQEEVIIYEN